MIKQFNLIFTRKVSKQTKLMFLFVLLPLYMFCASIIVTALLKFVILTFSLSLDYNAANAYLNLIADALMMVIAWLIFKDSLKEQWHDFLKDVKDNLIYGLLIGTALLYASSFIGGLLTLLLGGGGESVNQETISKITQSYPIVMMITTVILAPILEEILFRGIVFGWLYELNPKIAHFVSALLFGCMHILMALLAGALSEWTQIFSYFFMGIVLSYLYEKRNNLFVPICAHAANNFISMLMILFVL